VKIRLWGTEDECRQMAQMLINAPGFEVVSVSEPRVDRGASVLARMYVEARLTLAHAARDRARPRPTPPGAPAGSRPVTAEMRQ
jgi:hypothetical protein